MEYKKIFEHQKTKDDYINMVIKNVYDAHFLPEELKKDKEFALNLIKIVKLKDDLLRSLSTGLKDDKDVVLEVVKTHGMGLRFASSRLRGDYEVALTAFKADSLANAVFSDDLKTELQQCNVRLLDIRKYLEVAVMRESLNIDLTNSSIKKNRIKL